MACDGEYNVANKEQNSHPQARHTRLSTKPKLFYASAGPRFSVLVKSRPYLNQHPIYICE